LQAELLIEKLRSYFDDGVVRNLHQACFSAFVSCIRYPSSDVSDFIDFDRNIIAGSLKPDRQLVETARETTLNEVDADDDEDWSLLELQIRSAYSAISRAPEENIRKSTTIYRLGLDSISAIQVANQLRKSGLEIQSSDVMESPSCSELASVVQSRAQSPTQQTFSVPTLDLDAFDERYRRLALDGQDIASGNVLAIRPCTPVQSGMLSQYAHSEGHLYFNHTFYALDSSISCEDLKDAWAKVLAQHEIMRTGFISTDEHENPFVMLTYGKFDINDLWLQTSSQNSIGDYASLEQKAFDSVKSKLHLPPWRWSLVEVDGSRCMQWSAHHAIFDAESLRSILSDLKTALGGSDLPTKDSINGALNHILSKSQSDPGGQQTFWSQELGGASVTRFPNLTPIRAAKPELLIVERVMDTQRSVMETHCRESGVTLQAVGQAAWARLLSAYTGETNVTFGVVLSGRTSPETADAVFPCITTLPVVSNTAVDDEKLLQDLISYNASVQKYQFTPLTDIQKYAGLASEALFDSLFAYQRPLSNDISEASWKVVHEKASVELAVSIEMESLPQDQLGLRLTVHTDQIPSEQGEIMLRQMEVLILQLLSIEETINASVLSITSPKEHALPTTFQFMHEMVEGSTNAYPERIAVEFVDSLDGQVSSRHWNYRQFDAEANKIAHFLVNSGVSPGDVVATSFDKCPEQSFAVLAILKAGCAFCAIDHTAPAARKAFILEDSSAKILLTTESIRSELEGSTSCIIIDLLNLDEKMTLPTSPVTIVDLSPSSVSYVLYTSGTTGTPKGCEITHENAVQLLVMFQRLFEGRWTEHSRWLQFASYHFDVSIVEQFWTWSVGMRLVCAPRDLILEDIMGFISTMQITHLDLTPSLGRLLDPAMVPSLHDGVFITGGESLKQDMIDTWGDIGCLFNFYGPTECTIGVTVFPCVPRVGKPSNIGWQFDNVGTYVLAPGSDTPVLRGAIGELCISGALVGKGYLNRVELTKNCFPYLEAYKERIYRTGDVVRILHDGSIDFLGRKDNQVKLRGQRLEIDEIEAVIKRCEDVQDTLCLVAKHPKQQKDQLICFIGVDGSRKQGTPEFCAAASAKQLVQSARTACEEHLPGYMVPTHFLPIRRIPLSVNNKVEEKLLRQLYADMSATDIQAYSVQADSRQTFSDGERKVAGVLAELLKLDVDDMTPASNIFTLGLNSISAIQLSRRLKASGFLNAQVAIVLKGSTISKLTKSLATSIDQSDNEVADARQNISACQHRHLGTVTRVLRCKPDEIEVIAPCTALQQGIISRSLASESSLYFNTFRYSAGGVDLAKLESAFNQALERTQILRTFFIETNDGYVQAVKKSGYLPWWTLEVFDLATVDSVFTKRKEKWRSYNTTHLTVPFEVVVIRAGSEVFLSVDMHHALYDGISFELMMNNVFKLYKFEEADFGKPFVDCLPFGPLRNVQGAKEFWLDHLSNIQPTLMSSLSDKESSQDTLCVASLKVLKQADELRRSLGVTIQALVQACWIVTLRKYHQGAVGTVVSGRSIDFDGIEKVIGPLFNTIPFYLRCEAGDSWQTLVQRCHGFNTAALIYQHTPLRDISKWCNRGRAGPLFDTLFVFQGASEPSSTDISILTPHEDNHFEADYPLSFEAEETASGELKITLAAKASICNASRARELIEEFHQFFLAMVQDSENDVGVSVGYMFEQPTNTRTEDTIDTVSLRREDFEWTSEAAILRSEMATLAGVDETEIDQATSIFEIGLDSVDAVKLSSRLKKKELALPVSTIMQSQTIAGMISTLTGTKKDHSSLNSGDEFEETKKKLSAYAQGRIESKTGIECVLPASPMQEALVSGMVRSSYSAYFNHDVLKISKSIDLVRLEDAWRTVIEISPILRTGFLEIDDAEMDITFAQIIHKFDASSPLKLQIVGLPAEDAITDYLNRISSDASSMPLSHPQLQITRVSTPGDDYLVLSIAHALYDGHSLSLLHQDVLQAYNGTLQRRPFYGDFLKRMSNDSDEDAIAFWRGLLTSAKINQLSEMSNTTVGEITTHRAEKTSQLSAQDLAVFCKQQGVTLQAVCQTAWALILAHTVKSLDVMFGVVLAGRDSELAEDIMFPMMNTVIMRSVLHGSRRQVLQSIQATISDISTYQHFPLRRIQAACQSKVQSPAATSDKHAFFDTLFTFQRRPDKPDTELQTLYESVNGASEVEYPVAVEAEVVADSLIWRVACKSTAYDAQGASELLDTLDHILQAIVSRPHDPTLTFQNQAVSICGLCCFQQRGKGNVGQTAEALQESVDVVEVWSDTEASIRQVTAKVTKTPLADISKNMPIQNLGVDSINAIKIAALLRQKSIRISVSDIIRAGSISQMVMVIKDERPNEAVKSTIDTSEKSIATLMTRKDFTAEKFGYQQQDVVQLLPATAGQAYMLGAWQATSGQLFFGEFQYKTAVPTSIARIEQAWQQVVSNNAVLRTVFVATEDTEMPFLQLILRETPVSFVNLDVEENDSIEMKQPFARMMARRAGDAYELTLKIHHALYDAVSLPLLIQSLGDHLQGSDKTQQPSDGFANFIAQSMNTAEKSACQKFWTGYLKDTENPQLDYIPSPSARHIETYDPSAMSDISNVESALRKHGVSLQAVFFAAFARAYSFSTDPTAEDVIIGIYLANRAHLEDLSSLAAPTLNLVPLRVRTPTRTSLVELAKQVQKDLQAIGSATNSSVGLWEIEAWTGVKIDTFVNFVKIPDSSDDRDATKIDAIVVNQQTDGKRTEKRSQISEATGRGFVLPSELRHEVMSTTYQVSNCSFPSIGNHIANLVQRSLDIEAIVTDGTLGIGVFGWEDMMDLEQAEGLIDELKIEIEGALELGE
jgi:amino acid adenylation domain-containing protein